MFMKSQLRKKEEKREYWKVQAAGILTGVVLLIVIQILNEIFETPAFFGASIMLLSVIMLNLAYLVESRIKETSEKNTTESDVHHGAEKQP